MKVKHKKTGKIGDVVYYLGNDPKITMQYDIRWEDNSTSREPMRNIELVKEGKK